MTSRKSPPARSSSSFPQQFPRLLLHVATTLQPVTINNLGNERRFYTSFRSRVNEFRRAFYDEAMVGDNEHKITLAKQMYSVTLENPTQKDGQWQMVVKPKDMIFGQAIEDILPEKAMEHKPALPAPDEGTKAIEELFGEDREE